MNAERFRRIIQRTATRRMPQRALVSSLLYARTEIENWRREYNEERPKMALGGLTPAAYANSYSKFRTQTEPLLKAGGRQVDKAIKWLEPQYFVSNGESDGTG